MKLAVARGAPFHLTYCSNIHPGETWDEVLANIRAHTLVVKARLSPAAPFGLGLRLSARAAERLAEPVVLGAFRAFLAQNDLYVFTINGFPYGAFHGTSVKERVYLPDWLQDERLRYTDQLATILAALLPPGLDGSVSTVPGCFRARAEEPGAARAIAERLRRHAVTLWRLQEETGKTVGLALEPEPCCLLETTAEAIAFFEEHLFSRAGVSAFAALTGLGEGRAAETLRRHLGVCFDACHAAVEFESPDEALAGLARAGIRILKVQVSAGLQVAPADAPARAALRRFADDVYLHQVVIQGGPAGRGGEAPLRRLVDLPQALAEADTSDGAAATSDPRGRDAAAAASGSDAAGAVPGSDAAGAVPGSDAGDQADLLPSRIVAPGEGFSAKKTRAEAALPSERGGVRGGASGSEPAPCSDEWRVHFHVPLFREQLGPFRSTQPFLVRLLGLLGRSEICRQLEVETYTWDVLPEEFRREPVTDAIVRELQWTITHLLQPSPPAKARP